MKMIKGYSLIEMLIVLLIFSFLALISLSFLSSSTNSFFQVNSKTEDLKELIIASEIIKDDLIHLSDRPIRNEYGIQKRSFLLAVNLVQEGSVLEFVRYSSSDGAGQIGSLQKIKYVLEDGTLNRYTSTFLNSPYSNKALKLISDISELKINDPLTNSISPYEFDYIPRLLNFNIKIKEGFFNKIFIVSNA